MNVPAGDVVWLPGNAVGLPFSRLICVLVLLRM